MTVEEIIKELQKYPPKMNCIMRTEEYESPEDSYAHIVEREIGRIKKDVEREKH